MRGAGMAGSGRERGSMYAAIAVALLAVHGAWWLF
jgi:hypothetical protein